jgi:hypothetical protein
MGKRIRLRIPDAPEMEQPVEKERRRIKIRRNWTRSPVEQIVPNKKKNLEEKNFSNKGNLRKKIESELDDNETE